MRDLSTQQLYPLENGATKPRYLIQVELDTTLRLSTREGVTVDTYWWEPSDITLSDVSAHSCTFRIYNTDYKYTNGAMRGEYLRNAVTVWSAYEIDIASLPPYTVAASPVYWPADYTEAQATVDKFIIFKGFISSTPTVGEWLTVKCDSFLLKKYPSVKLRAPTANHLPAPGSVISWGSETYRIET